MCTTTTTTTTTGTTLQPIHEEGQPPIPQETTPRRKGALRSRTDDNDRNDGSARSTRSVEFDSKVRVFLHIHHADMSSRTLTKTWYSEKEFGMIAREASSILGTSQDDESSSHEERETSYCHRGLEHLTVAGYTRRLRNKHDAWAAVLGEQYRQWEEDFGVMNNTMVAGSPFSVTHINTATTVLDQEAIASVYRQISEKHLIKARILATQDAMDVDMEVSFADKMLIHSSRMSSPPRVGTTKKREIHNTQLRLCLAI